MSNDLASKPNWSLRRAGALFSIMVAAVMVWYGMVSFLTFSFGGLWDVHPFPSFQNGLHFTSLHFHVSLLFFISTEWSSVAERMLSSLFFVKAGQATRFLGGVRGVQVLKRVRAGGTSVCWHSIGQCTVLPLDIEKSSRRVSNIPPPLSDSRFQRPNFGFWDRPQEPPHGPIERVDDLLAS